MLPLNRRRFVNFTAASAVASFASPARIAAAKSEPRVKAIAFDGLVVFDLGPIVALAEQLFPGRGTEVSNAWRSRQFEYTWLRTLTGDYANFWQVTGDALTFTAKLLDLDLTQEKHDRLMEAFLRLKAWPDVLPTLTAFNLKTAVGRSDGLAVCDFSRFGCISLARGGEARGAGGR